MAWFTRLFLCVLFVGVACAPASDPSRGAQGSRSQDGTGAAAPKAVTLSINEDPGSFWEGITGGGGGGARQLGHLVNQYLVALKSDALPEPRLLAELPALDKGTWTLLPDGKMETTWKLRPGVVWHDGTPLTADDIVFSIQVNKDPEVPNGNQATVRLITGAQAVDPLTVAVSWSGVYPFAERLEHRELIPVPKHLLETPYREAKDTLLQQAYFSSEYVGLGPYRLTRWERGSHLDLVAFDRYFLGRPKIDTMRVQFLPDDNTIIANLLAGSVHAFLPTGGPSFEQMMQVKRQWDAAGRGQVLLESVRWTFVEAQKTRSAQPIDLLDPRVRRALQHAIDRVELTKAVLGEEGIVADSWVHPSFPYYAAVQDALTRYPYDPRRASALLAEAGWERGSDGVLAKGAERFRTVIRYRAEETEANIVRDAWKGIGVDGSLEYVSDQQLRDRALRAQYTGVDINNNPMGGLSAIRRFESAAIPTSDNRWTGTNRGAYSNPQFDAIGDQFRVTLEENKRVELERELVRIFSSDLPSMPIYYEIQTVPMGGGLVGIQPIRGIAHTGHVMHTWNVHEWDLQGRS